MNKISALRNIVSSGWTIANRRAVASQIGKKQFDEIATLARKTDLDPNLFHYEYIKSFITEPGFLDKLKHYVECMQTGIDQLWGRKLNLGHGNTNAEFYPKFKKMYTGAKTFISDEAKKPRRELFDTCKPLGCDKIHYRGETYIPSCPKELEHFNKLKNLKVGDKYKPGTNIWISNSKAYAHENYGSYPDYKNVRYTILANENSKIIETPYGRYGSALLSEGIYDDRAVFEVCERVLKDDNTLYLYLKHIS